MIKLINAYDLKCGDVFIFRDVIYVALLCNTDERHTTTFVTALPEDLSVKLIISIRFFQTFKVAVTGHLPLELIKLDNTEDEITSQDLLDFEGLNNDKTN